MKALARVLVVKIALTLSAWSIPLLLFPKPLLTWLGFPVPEPALFLRLLGMAYVALIVAYCFGLRAAQRGEYPATVVWVGIVSNAGACLVLGWFALLGAWSAWGGFAQFVMWASLLGTGAIAAALVVFGPGGEHATRFAAARSLRLAGH